MVRILTYIHDMELLRDLMELTRNETWIHLMALSEFPNSIDIFTPLAVDVLLLDCTQNHEAAAAFIAALYVEQKPPFQMMYMVDQRKQQPLTAIMAHDPDAVLLYEPFSVGKIMIELMKNSARQQSGVYNDEGMISQLIQDMGIPVHLNGFRYLKTGTLCLLHDADQTLLMHQVYKQIARIHMTTSSRVEKAIRDAIDYAYRKTPEKIEIQQHKPTNSQLVHLLYERMLQQQQSVRKERKAKV